MGKKCSFAFCSNIQSKKEAGKQHIQFHRVLSEGQSVEKENNIFLGIKNIRTSNTLMKLKASGSSSSSVRRLVGRQVVTRTFFSSAASGHFKRSNKSKKPFFSCDHFTEISQVLPPPPFCSDSNVMPNHETSTKLDCPSLRKCYKEPNQESHFYQKLMSPVKECTDSLNSRRDPTPTNDMFDSRASPIIELDWGKHFLGPTCSDSNKEPLRGNRSRDSPEHLNDGEFSFEDHNLFLEKLKRSNHLGKSKSFMEFGLDEQKSYHQVDIFDLFESPSVNQFQSNTFDDSGIDYTLEEKIPYFSEKTCGPFSINECNNNYLESGMSHMTEPPINDSLFIKDHNVGHNYESVRLHEEKLPEKYMTNYPVHETNNSRLTNVQSSVPVKPLRESQLINKCTDHENPTPSSSIEYNTKKEKLREAYLTLPKAPHGFFSTHVNTNFVTRKEISKENDSSLGYDNSQSVDNNSSFFFNETSQDSNNDLNYNSFIPMQASHHETFRGANNNFENYCFSPLHSYDQRNEFRTDKNEIFKDYSINQSYTHGSPKGNFVHNNYNVDRLSELADERHWRDYTCSGRQGDFDTLKNFTDNVHITRPTGRSFNKGQSERHSFDKLYGEKNNFRQNYFKPKPSEERNQMCETDEDYSLEIPSSLFQLNNIQQHKLKGRSGYFTTDQQDKFPLRRDDTYSSDNDDIADIDEILMNAK